MKEEWLVVSMDDIIARAFSYHEARQACIELSDDGRKYPDIQRLRPGLYIYAQSPRYPTQRSSTYWIGRKSELEAEGFDLDELGE